MECADRAGAATALSPRQSKTRSEHPQRGYSNQPGVGIAGICNRLRFIDGAVDGTTSNRLEITQPFMAGFTMRKQTKSRQVRKNRPAVPHGTFNKRAQLPSLKRLGYFQTTSAFGRLRIIEQSTRLVRTKAVTRSRLHLVTTRQAACHRSPGRASPGGATSL